MTINFMRKLHTSYAKKQRVPLALAISLYRPLSLSHAFFLHLGTSGRCLPFKDGLASRARNQQKQRPSSGARASMLFLDRRTGARLSST